MKRPMRLGQAQWEFGGHRGEREGCRNRTEPVWGGGISGVQLQDQDSTFCILHFPSDNPVCLALCQASCPSLVPWPYCPVQSELAPTCSQVSYSLLRYNRSTT